MGAATSIWRKFDKLWKDTNNRIRLAPEHEDQHQHQTSTRPQPDHNQTTTRPQPDHTIYIHLLTLPVELPLALSSALPFASPSALSSALPFASPSTLPLALCWVSPGNTRAPSNVLWFQSCCKRCIEHLRHLYHACTSAYSWVKHSALGMIYFLTPTVTRTISHTHSTHIVKELYVHCGRLDWLSG